MLVFVASIISIARSSDKLQKCSPDSVVQSALKAAALNLPIEPALGYAAIVPYKTTAQFQLMYKGVIQLCIRSGQYATIHNSEVYKDEIKSYNPITGELVFTDASTWKMRDAGKPSDIAGFYAAFKLTTGFAISSYMTVEAVITHAKRFSRSYQYDVKENKESSVWTTDPISMGKKTVLKALLSRYGIMSVEMQDAFVADADNYEATAGKEAETIKDKMGSKPVDAKFENAPPQPEQPAGSDDDFMQD